MIVRRERQAGFTLIEVMAGLLLTSVVALALGGAFLVGYRTLSTEARQISADQAVSASSLSLIRDLSSATTIGTGTITPGLGTLTVTYGSPVTTATYSIDASKNLLRSTGAASSVAARGMQSFTIAAGNPSCAYIVTLLPSASGASAVTLRATRRVGTAGCF